jgi:hypothetical protein
MKNDKMSKRKKAITDYFMQSKKLNTGEDSMKTCQIMLFGIGIAAKVLLRYIQSDLQYWR